jgi:phenylalanyl-tRNA synthetase beta chain
MKVSRDWLQTYFDTELPSADDIAAVLTAHAFEVEGVEHMEGGDATIDIDVLANRSSDCLSHRGIARELSTLLALPLRYDPLREPLPAWPVGHRLTVEVTDTELCPRYIAAVVRGVTVKPSPAWLQARLASIGQRSINNIVDATNFVMFSIGQPLHAFDLGKIHTDTEGFRTIEVRPAHQNETITTLTGDVYTLQPSNLIIADRVAGVPLAIAGIKGGVHAEIDQETTDIVLEAAHFNYTSVRKTSRGLRLATDASVRFQNEPAHELPAFALRDVLALILDIAGGELMGVKDMYTGPRERIPTDVTLSDINLRLGTTLSYDDVERILIRFEWEFSRSRDEFTITAPWERTDLTCREAYIEEIGRVYGYQNIVGILPPAPTNPPRVHRTQYYTDMLRHALLTLGYSEVLTYTLRNRGEVALQNPLASDKALLRMSLADGMRDALDQNASTALLLGLSDIKLFEIGTIFTTAGERLSLALGARAVHTKASVLQAQLKEDSAHLQALLGHERTNEASPVVQEGIIELPLEHYLTLLPTPHTYESPLPWNTEARFTMWSRYPYIARDIAVWVPADIQPEVVIAHIEEQGTDLLIRTDMFDTFEKNGRTSYAWHLVFQSNTKTLTDDEVGTIMERITLTLNNTPQWEVR